MKAKAYGERVIRRKHHDLIPLCPMCRSRVYWQGYGYRGDEQVDSRAICSNSPRATQIIYRGDSTNVCVWEGTVKHNENGTVTVYSFNGVRVPYRVIKRA